MKFLYLDSEDMIYASDKYESLEDRYDEVNEVYSEYLGQYSEATVNVANEIKNEIYNDIDECKIEPFDSFSDYVYELVKRLEYEEESFSSQ